MNCKVEEINLREIHVIRLNSGDIYTPINSTLLDEFLYEKASAGVSYHKLNSLSSALKSFFKFLYRNDNFPDVTSSMRFDLKKYKDRRKPIRILSKHETLRLFHSIVTHSDNIFNEAVLFSLLFSTGMRISELLGVKVNELDLESDMLLLKKTKTKKARVVALRNGFGDVLKHYIKINMLSDCDYLFNKNGKKLSNGDVRSILNIYIQKANLPHVTIHSIRHSFATYMIDAGASIFIVQQLLGHEFISSTEHYINPNYTRNKNITIHEHQYVYKKVEGIINSVCKNE
ncbi:tyrosine-type recombinase/integrase [Anaerobacillus arseniciselenatis]|uniref:tyrosine-type recombinase/integrase n=1 Tax=Anaerobacillus arseniciselenatis TaxID=85682 RepID=UPI001FE0F446|nr:tyrosine-type recombinase/integrase [Anaerobacillus arseniciselenatis]